MWVMLLVTALVILAILYLYGLLSPVTLYYHKLLNPHLLYYSFKGLESEIGGQFDKITKDSEGHFKISDGFGIYLSPPEEPVWKCVLGMLVNPGEESKVRGFMEAHPEYKEVRLESTRYVGTQLPFINFLSFYVLWKKIPAFMSLVQKEDHPLFPGSF